MSRIAYVNGRYVPHRHAVVHVEDRGYQFADGVYEVVYVQRGRPVDAGLHLARLTRSLAELRIPAPVGEAALLAILDELRERGHVIEAPEAWTMLVGGMQAVAIDPRTRVAIGAADPRRDGYVAAA